MQEESIDYEALVDAELQAAASAPNQIEKKRRLDQAAIYAALNEKRQRQEH